jgi:hypothetical protein
MCLFLSFAAALWCASVAPAAHVQCGDVITQDTTLDSDLNDCPGDGIVIGADSITLNLAGHVIDGVGSGRGVDNEAGHDGVTVQNGWIEDFNAPVYFNLANNGILRRLTVPGDNQGPIQLWSSSSNTIRRNVILSGINLFWGSNENTIDRNTIDTEVTGILIAGLPGFPPVPGVQATGNVVTANRITGHGQSTGIHAYLADSTVIQANEVRDLGRAGILLGNFGSGNQVLGNLIVGSGLQGIHVADEQGGVLIAQNQITDSALDGILLESFTGPITVERNNASRNGDDGVDSDTLETTFMDNRTKHNGDLGIEAQPGVTDGGGNVARGNGNPAQCVGVTCTN